MLQKIKLHFHQIRTEYDEVNQNNTLRNIIDALILILDLLIMLVVSIGAVALITQEGSWLTFVDGESMSPTLSSSQIMFVDKSEITRGDIITIDATDYKRNDSSQSVFIKRLVGMPGDRIVIKNNQVIINGEVYEESYLTEEARKQTMTQIKYNSVKLDDDEYFIMGDNRGNSYDSRHFGVIKAEHILDKQSASMTDYAMGKFGIVGIILILDIALFFLVEFILKECAYMFIIKFKTKSTTDSTDTEMVVEEVEDDISKVTTSETIILEGD